MTWDQFAYLGEPHHECLEVLSAEALKRGDLDAAYRLADRRCRIRPLPEAHCFVLRAEALYRMGERTAAIDDIETALKIAPEDLGANRRMLAWARSHRQMLAAGTLIDCEQDFRILRQAITLLRKRGKTAFAAMKVRGDFVEGWAVWQRRGQICLAVTDKICRIEQHLEPDQQHPLATVLGNAVSFRLPTPMTPEVISMVNEGDVLCELRIGGRGPNPAPVPLAHDLLLRPAPAVTVIVPVYRDYGATKTCLERLLAQLDGTGRHRLIIVDDASPDRRIKELLDPLRRAKHVHVLSNARNLGFVGAVNRALGEVVAGDVILLNSDTIVPEGVIDRLAAAARSSAEIGTVTPLSNNGEFTSFPAPNKANAVGNGADVENIDRLAARVNANAVVDIPNGIGFCLYITRACLDAVGPLSESYHRGYLEDVDFCLRARRKGFRNVCSPSVYVGHAGSRSFRRQKRSLVLRNLRVVERRFPAYRGECADFVLADPLKAARRAIELGMIDRIPCSILMVTPSGAVAEVARERARQLSMEEATAAVVLEMRRGSGHVAASLRDMGGGVPQSLDFALPGGDPAELLEVLRQAPLRRMEVFAPDEIPPIIMDALLQLSVACDVFLSHAPGSPAWHNVAAKAKRVLVPDAQAAAIAVSIPHPGITVLPPVTSKRHSPSRYVSGRAARLGLLPIRRCMREHHFMRELVAKLASNRATLEVVVIGSTQDDAELMRAGAFVTGPVDAKELDMLIGRYQLDRIVACATRPLFGHPLLLAATTCAVPVAFLDWSRGACRGRNGDLMIDPPASAEVVITRLLPWLEEIQAA